MQNLNNDTMIDIAETRQQILNALKMLRIGTPCESGMSVRIAAAMIVAALTPPLQKNAGSEYHRIKAEDWMSMILASEPDVSVELLAERVKALSDVSPFVKEELGGITGRLCILVMN